MTHNFSDPKILDQKKYLVLKKNLIQKQFLVQKNFWSEKDLCQKNLGGKGRGIKSQILLGLNPQKSFRVVVGVKLGF